MNEQSSKWSEMGGYTKKVVEHGSIHHGMVETGPKGSEVLGSGQKWLKMVRSGWL